MIIMKLKVDGFFSFENFEVDFSYPKKLVNATIEGEYLSTRKNFRYKKVNIFMGANASGKTTFGKIIMYIFNFLKKKDYDLLLEGVKNQKRANFLLDFVIEETLYRVECIIKEKNITTLKIFSVEIGLSDSYEMAEKKLIEKYSYIKGEEEIDNSKILEGFLNIPQEKLYWLFTFPGASSKNSGFLKENIVDLKILDYILRTLDTSILKVTKSKEVKNTYHIHFKAKNILTIQEGEVIRENILSSGTLEGISISYIISSICKGIHGFYYVDEKCSYIQSDIEVSLLNLMIGLLGKDKQLFYTTHNVEVIEMSLPIHSYNFFKKKDKIELVKASDYVKKNDRSLASCIRNDVFDTLPEVNLIDELYEVCSHEG